MTLFDGVHFCRPFFVISMHWMTIAQLSYALYTTSMLMFLSVMSEEDNRFFCLRRRELVYCRNARERLPHSHLAVRRAAVGLDQRVEELAVVLEYLERRLTSRCSRDNEEQVRLSLNQHVQTTDMRIEKKASNTSYVRFVASRCLRAEKN